MRRRDKIALNERLMNATRNRNEQARIARAMDEWRRSQEWRAHPHRQRAVLSRPPEPRGDTNA